MAPGINLLRRSLRGSDYESKPSTNASTVSSLTCSVVTRDVINEINVVKRSISQDRTLDTEVESVDLKDSLGSSSGIALPVRRLSSSGSRSNHSNKNKDSIGRKLSIQDEVMKDEESGIDTSSVSSITLESDIRLYHKTKSRSFHDIRSVPSVNRSRSMGRNRRVSSASAGASHSLERIREESSRFNTMSSSCSQFTEKEHESLTLTELESVSGNNFKIEKERPSNCFIRNRSYDGSTSEHCISKFNLDTSQHKKQHLRRIVSRGDQSTASTESYVSTETLELISSLHEAKIENESTIERLEHELSELACERDAFRTNSDRVVQVLTAQQTELEAQLKKERKGFANVSSLHKKELKDWMDKAALLSTKVLDLEQNAKNRELDDESRAEKILNLERNIAKLFKLKSNSIDESGHYDKDMEEVEKSLHAFDAASSEGKKLNDKTQLRDELLEQHNMQYEDLHSQLKKSQASIEKLQEENKLLKQSNESNGCNDELLNKICDLVDENAELVERCQELEILKEENEVLHESLMESNSKLDTAQKTVDDLKSKNADLEEALELERNACEYLRQESQMYSDDCSDDLRVTNEKLTIELEEKNEAMKLIKTTMESLKADQQSIKEVVVKLRMENLQLRDEKEEAAKINKPVRPPPPPHPKSVGLKEKAGLEARLEKLEKENRVLSESNVALSTKLSEEKERMKSLEVANKGLAARICKLVALIKEQGK